MNNVFSKEQIMTVLLDSFHQYQQERESDIFVISGDITRSFASQIVYQIQEFTQKQRNVSVFLCTYGGDPDAAYIIAKAFKRNYESFNLYVSGYCKSAGTLIALGADELIVSETGELGPLDIQLMREDSITAYGSGLDVSWALSSLRLEAFALFEDVFLNIIGRSGGSITAKTAAGIATDLAAGLLSPIAAQIDPIKAGETARFQRIALEYGMRLGAAEETILLLINNYPSHGFVIDVEEAIALFPNARPYDTLETLVELYIGYVLKRMDELNLGNILQVPSQNGFSIYLSSDQNEEEHEQTDSTFEISQQGTSRKGPDRNLETQITEHETTQTNECISTPASDNKTKDSGSNH